MSLQFVLIILVVNYLRKVFQTKIALPVWNRRLLLIMYASIACMMLQLTLSSFKSGFNLLFAIIEDGLVGLLLYIVYEEEEFKSAKFLLVALLPYAIVSFLDDILQLFGKKFYTPIEDVAETVTVFAVIWGIGVWVVSRKQQKELTKARAKALEEQENNRIITAMKGELEVQVAERTAELTKQNQALEETLIELKSTQAQLIQSEKMASLGELTAGIAHEIQNPLNFVNNFSEVNNELIEELVQQVLNDTSEDAKEEAREILNDIKQNNEKIAHHGKRADAIVKGMLQHSRTNTGQNEPTDINALCDEYLRLSYHGLRAKDKSFNATFETNFDEALSANGEHTNKVDVVPQDMGRVLLNMFNNAFYAVNEKRKAEGESYKPIVSVKTKKIDNEVEIIVSDNGNGIPQNIIDKIFQPFFTTKPTGQGTGLGLSLSYDIIKAHSGTIRMESKEGKGTEFIIEIPIT